MVLSGFHVCFFINLTNNLLYSILLRVSVFVLIVCGLWYFEGSGRIKKVIKEQKSVKMKKMTVSECKVHRPAVVKSNANAFYATKVSNLKVAIIVMKKLFYFYFLFSFISDLKMRDSENTKRKVHSSELFSVRVGELTEGVTDADLKEVFDAWGEIGDVWMPKDHDTGRSRGFAFVRYFKKDDRDNCLEAASETPILVSKVQVTVSYAKQQSRNSPPPRRRERSPRDSRRRNRSRTPTRRDSRNTRNRSGGKTRDRSRDNSRDDSRDKSRDRSGDRSRDRSGEKSSRRKRR